MTNNVKYIIDMFLRKYFKKYSLISIEYMEMLHEKEEYLPQGVHKFLHFKTIRQCKRWLKKIKNGYYEVDKGYRKYDFHMKQRKIMNIYITTGHYFDGCFNELYRLPISKFNERINFKQFLNDKKDLLYTLEKRIIDSKCVAVGIPIKLLLLDRNYDDLVELCASKNIEKINKKFGSIDNLKKIIWRLEKYFYFFENLKKYSM